MKKTSDYVALSTVLQTDPCEPLCTTFSVNNHQYEKSDEFSKSGNKVFYSSSEKSYLFYSNTDMYHGWIISKFIDGTKMTDILYLTNSHSRISCPSRKRIYLYQIYIYIYFFGHEHYCGRDRA